MEKECVVVDSVASCVRTALLAAKGNEIRERSGYGGARRGGEPIIQCGLKALRQQLQRNCNFMQLQRQHVGAAEVKGGDNGAL